MKPYYEHGGIVIYHGDCLDVLRSLPIESIDAVITDPPYGIDYQSAWRIDKSQMKAKIANDTRPFIWWLWDAFRIAREVSALACFCRWDVQEIFRLSIEAAGFDVKSEVVWDRQVHGMGDLGSDFAPRHDTIWFGVKGGFKFHGSRPPSVLSCQRLGGEQLAHPNEKPLGLLKQLIRPLTPQKGYILDPFLGSGTTLIAAKSLGMSAIGIEVSERYCELAAKQLSQEVMDFSEVSA